MAVQASLCLAWSETPEDMFCRVMAQMYPPYLFPWSFQSGKLTEYRNPRSPYSAILWYTEIFIFVRMEADYYRSYSELGSGWVMIIKCHVDFAHAT